MFPRTLPDGHVETWFEAQERLLKLNDIIAAVPQFDVITPTNEGVEAWKPEIQSRMMLMKDLIYATHSDIVFADMTPFGGREPDSGTVVEATACVLSGGLLVLWADPLTTYAEKYADADVHPESELDLHYNLMIEQLFYQSWEAHFGFSVPVFDGLEAAVAQTAKLVVPQPSDLDLEKQPDWITADGSFQRISLMNQLESCRGLCLQDAILSLLGHA